MWFFFFFLVFFFHSLCVSEYSLPGRRRWVEEERGGGEDKDAIPKGRERGRSWHRATLGSVVSSLAFPFFHRRFVVRFFLFFKKIPNLQCCVEKSDMISRPLASFSAYYRRGEDHVN